MGYSVHRVNVERRGGSRGAGDATLCVSYILIHLQTPKTASEGLLQLISAGC